MENPRLGSLIDHFALLPDPRIDRTKRHLWLDIVVMTVCAVIGGADTWVDLAEYGRAKYEWLKRFLTSYERRYDIRSLGPDAKQIGDSVPGHWAIENALHWVLEIACREDDRRIRKGNAPENFAMLRQIAVNLLTQERTHQHGVKAKRNRAGWDNDDLLTVLSI